MWMYWMSDKTPVSKNIYNDFNRHLVNVFECSRNPQHYHDVLQQYLSCVGNSDKFQEYRDEVFSIYGQQFTIPDYDMAAKYMLLQTQMFSGGKGLHERSKIYHNPKYKSKYITYVEKFTQPKYLNKLRVFETENLDCRSVIQKYDGPETFFYVDPPYFNMEDYYTKNSFGRDDHIELLTLMSGMKGRFALSYYYFQELEDIMPRSQFYWHEEQTYSINGLTKVSDAKRKDGSAASGVRTERTEVLILNYVPTSTHQTINSKLANTELFEFR